MATRDEAKGQSTAGRMGACETSVPIWTWPLCDDSLYDAPQRSASARSVELRSQDSGGDVSEALARCREQELRSPWCSKIPRLVWLGTLTLSWWRIFRSANIKIILINIMLEKIISHCIIKIWSSSTATANYDA